MTRISVPMRDGIVLAADLRTPHLEPSTRLPSLLLRTPYGRARYASLATALAAHGYAVVVQDVRGRHDSEGDWYPYRNEGPDGYDTIEWLADRPWSNGRVGMFGGSYSGWVQWSAARERPQHLAALAPAAAGGQWVHGAPFDNGMVSLVMLAWLHLTAGRVMNDNSAVDWREVFHQLPLRSMDAATGTDLAVWRDWLSHPTPDDYWGELTLADEDFARIDLPALHITGWFDDDQCGALAFYESMLRHSPARDRQAVLIGPWNHGGTRNPRRVLNGVDFGAASALDMLDVQVRWFDRWLREPATASFTGPRADCFITGVNRWLTTPVWPPGDGTATFFLQSTSTGTGAGAGGGALAEEAPDEVGVDRFTFDPADPVIAVPDFDFYNESAGDDPLDLSCLAERADVLVYTSPELPEPLGVGGRPTAVVYGSSDRRDTDWVVSLHDVAPDGGSLQLCAGRLRARYRDSLAVETLLEPGGVYRFVVEMSSVGHVFGAGHRVRLMVTSSDFPRWDRNANSGLPVGDDVELLVARNAVHHGGRHPSCLSLPLLSDLPVDPHPDEEAS